METWARQNARGEGSENEQIRALAKIHKEALKDVEFLDDSTEFELIKRIFRRVDWRYSGGFENFLIGKEFEQIIFYAKREKIDDWEKYVEIVHFLGQIWAEEVNKIKSSRK